VSCSSCHSERVAYVSGKTSDKCFFATPKKSSHQGYVPNDVGLGDGGDYLRFDYCLDCGRIQGNTFPIDQEIIDAIDEPTETGKVPW